MKIYRKAQMSFKGQRFLVKMPLFNNDGRWDTNGPNRDSKQQTIPPRAILDVYADYSGPFTMFENSVKVHIDGRDDMNIDMLVSDIQNLLDRGALVAEGV